MKPRQNSRHQNLTHQVHRRSQLITLMQGKIHQQHQPQMSRHRAWRMTKKPGQSPTQLRKDLQK